MAAKQLNIETFLSCVFLLLLKSSIHETLLGFNGTGWNIPEIREEVLLVFLLQNHKHNSGSNVPTHY